jgi:hypothetical protein
MKDVRIFFFTFNDGEDLSDSGVERGGKPLKTYQTPIGWFFLVLP